MKYTVRVDDVSPMILYEGTWGSISSGQVAEQYSGNTLHSTSTNGSTVSFSFKGSSVSIVGSKGANHGKFIISIDQDQSKQQIIDGFSSNSIYQTPLYAIDGLSGDKHTIKVTNFVEDSSRSVLDVDYIEFVTGQDDNVANVDFVIDDNNSTVSYSPQDAWSRKSIGASQSYNGTLHTSNVANAKSTIPFEGNAVYVYGSLNSTYGLLSLAIDGTTPVTLNCSSPEFRPGTLLFYSDDFSSGKHVLTLSVPSDSNKPIDFDYVNVIRWSDNNGLGKNKAKTPLIAGVVSGGVVLLAWIAYFSFWLYRRHKNPKDSKLKDQLALIECEKAATAADNHPHPPPPAA